MNHEDRIMTYKVANNDYFLLSLDIKIIEREPQIRFVVSLMNKLNGAVKNHTFSPIKFEGAVEQFNEYHSLFFENMDNPKTPRQFKVETPLGNLIVSAKHGPMEDIAHEHPGVCIEFDSDACERYGYENGLIAIVDYRPGFNQINTRAYQLDHDDPVSSVFLEIPSEEE